MSLEDTSTIDLVVNSPEGRGGELLIVDGGDTTDEIRRYQLLTDKLAVYVNYVASGQYAEQLPGVAPEDVTIRVVCTRPPNEPMKQIVSICTREETILKLPVILETELEFEQRLAALPPATGTKKPLWKYS